MKYKIVVLGKGEVCQQKRLNKKGKMVWTGHWFNSLVTRRFSIYLTWVFVKLGISANTVTFLMIVAGLVGFAFCIPHLLWLNILGLICLYLIEPLDCSDGEVARWAKKSSIKGFFLDLITHVLCNHLINIILPLHLYFMTHRVVYIWIAFVTYAASISTHAINKCRFQVDFSILKKGGDLADIKQDNVPYVWRCLRGGIAKLTDSTLFILLLPFPIIFLHVGWIHFVVLLSWGMMVVHVSRLIILILNSLFFDLSDLSHTKNL